MYWKRTSGPPGSPCFNFRIARDSLSGIPSHLWGKVVKP